MTDTGVKLPTLRVAVIGAGPAGTYAADILLKLQRDFDVVVDLFERLPAPYGLVRYGVAPDHPRIKGIINALKEVLDEGQIRYFGNVNFGTDITLDDLKKHYHAVIFATGAITDAPLEIPGIDAAGAFGAADFVNWFDGHPDVPRTWPLEAESVAVIGNGNVALDISRMLVKHADDLLTTEIPDNVYEGLAANPIKELHIFGRRGPLQVKFTPLELRELGEVRDVDMVLDERDFTLTDDYLAALPQQNKQVLVMTRIFDKWRAAQRARAAGDEAPASRQLVFHFWSKPIGVETDVFGRVSGVKIQRTAPDGSGGVVDTDQVEVIPVQALYRAIGYYGSELPGVPFDAVRGVIPNEQGRVATGVYATGWIKRGPVGLIGATKSDAKETIDSLVADWRAGLLWQPDAADADPAVIPALLNERGVAYTTVAGWQKLDAYERELGATHKHQRERLKVVDRDEMIRVSNS
ncbi:FAD-dependent oxidoreductase [Canibacter zhoujuaniae]|uniref:FAD-dependent oxidoreductase n=1 Tax=Canibacter zhoujuaniae TaxID=2708343 RepID=UPI001FB88AD7|nr:FAD-dependent oxidoreductase [Canibacter zhoujuaniae]